MDPKREIQSVVPINEECMLINYKIADEVLEPNKTTNVVIAGLTTAYARLELYKYLDMLGTDRVYYFDTDNILFTHAPGELMPEKGSDDRRAGKVREGAYISEYVSGGPKNYAYKIYLPETNVTKTHVKVNPSARK